MKKSITFLKTMLLAIMVAGSCSVFGQGIFTSAVSGNWNDAGSWTLSSGSDADGIPDADDNVTITTHNITVPTGVTVACNNLTVNNAAQRVLMQGAGSILEIYGTLNAAATPTIETLIDCTADATAKVVFKRITDGALIGTTWAGIGTAARFEVNLPTGVIGTTTTAVKAREIIITSGTLSLTGGLRPDNGAANGGILTIQDGATLIVTAAISRTGTTNTPFASLTINGTGKIIINGTFPTPLPTVVSGFPVYTFSSGATIEYQGGIQAIADINYPNLKFSAGTKSWALGANRTVTGNINVNGSSIFQVGGSQLTVSGNVTVDEGAQIGCSNNSGTIVAAAAGTQTFTLNGLCRVTSNSTQAPTPTTGFNRQFAFDAYVIGANSIVSFRNPTTSSSVSLNIDQPTGVSFANVEFYDIQTAAFTTTYLLKQNLVVSGSIAFPRIASGQPYVFDMNGFNMKVGKQILNSLGTIGLNTGNSNTSTGTRTYTMSGTIELNGSSAQTTLGGTDLPQTFNNLTINNVAGVTVVNPITVNGTTTVNGGSKLAMGATLTANGVVTVNGTFQLNASGWATGSGTWTYGGNGTLTFNNTSSYGVNSGDVFWPTTNGPVNVSVLQGGLTLNSGTDRAVSGLFQTAAGVTLNANLALNGTTQINAGGYFANAPAYGSSSTLIYNTGGTFGRYKELDTTTPANLQISNNTTLNYPNGAIVARTLTGNLTIDAGSSLYMDYGISGMNQPLTVNGNVTLNGNLSLGNDVGGDLYVGGNWVTGTGSNLYPNSRAVLFNGTTEQTITNAGTSTYDYMFIQPGAKVTLAAGNSLTVTNFTINSSASGTGTFINNGTLTNTNANVNQYLALPRRTWYMSSPVESASPAGSFVIRSYDEQTNLWGAASLPMVFGKGYSVTPPADGTNNILFTGTLNTGEKMITLDKKGSTSQAGFNFVGNPYPSYIDWKAMVTKNNAVLENGTMWYRTKIDATTYKYFTVDALGNVVPANTAVTAFIPPMQGFWIKTNTDGSTLYFEDNMRSHAGTTANPSPNPLKAPAAQTAELPLLRLQVSNGTNVDEAVIYSYAAATNGYDFYDSPKMSNNDATIPEIYTTLNNKPMVINVMNSLPLDTEIGLAFVPGDASSFSLKASEISNLPSDVKVILKDYANSGLETDLTDGVTVYNFAPATTTGDRFSVIFRSTGSTTGVDTNNDNAISVYSIQNGIHVTVNSDLNENSSVRVFNAVGQQLVNQHLTNRSTTVKSNFTPGVYVVKVSNGPAGTVTQKIVIK